MSDFEYYSAEERDEAAKKGVYIPRRSGKSDWGVAGQRAWSHAEKQVSRKSPNEPIGVSRPMCPDCIRYFAALAKERDHFQVVADKHVAHIFLPDGSETTKSAVKKW